jgi:hypothetical protein
VKSFSYHRVLVNFPFWNQLDIEFCSWACCSARNLLFNDIFSLSFVRIVPEPQTIYQSLKQEEIAQSEIRAMLRYRIRARRKEDAGFYAAYRPAISQISLPEGIKVC